MKHEKALVKACRWLRDQFALQEQYAATDMQQRALEAGIALRTLHRAKADLGIASRKGREHSHAGYTWVRPAHWGPQEDVASFY